MKKNRFISGILLVLGLYLIVSLTRNIFSLVKKGEEIKEQNLKLEKLRQKNLELKAELEYVKSSEFVERQARDKLGMAKEGEQVVVLPKNVEEIVLDKEKDKDKGEEELPNWKRWYRLFF